MATAGGARGAGVLVTLEGPDGAGKSTQRRILAERLRAEGRAVVETREPGGTEGAEEIRALLVGGAAGRWSAESEILLFTAARRDHWEKVIAPALAEGAVVVCDRFVDSTRVYQGTTPALRGLVDRLHAMAIGGEAGMTVLLDIEADAALARAGARTRREGEPAGGVPESRFERKGLDHAIGVAARFRALAAEAPGRWRIVDARGTPGEVAARVWTAVAPDLGLPRVEG